MGVGLRQFANKRRANLLMAATGEMLALDCQHRLGRLGRVIHWASALGTLGVVIGAIGQTIQYPDNLEGSAMLVVAVGLLVVGRAVRYILPQE